MYWRQGRKNQGHVEVMIPIDLGKWHAAMGRLGRSMAEFAEAFRNWRPLFIPSARDDAIGRHGPRNVAADGTWITDLCASWLHESCPSAEHCDCRCHSRVEWDVS